MASIRLYLFFGKIFDIWLLIKLLKALLQGSRYLTTMSGLSGFLFGNIDEEGRLDNDDFDEVKWIIAGLFLLIQSSCRN